MANLRDFGPCDNANFYNAWLRSDTFFDKLFMSNVGTEPFVGSFDDSDIPTMAYIAWYGNSLFINPNKTPNRSDVNVGFWVDLMAPKVSTLRVLEIHEARAHLVESVKAVLREEVFQRVSTATQQQYVDLTGMDEATWRNVDNMDHEAAMHHLKVMARHAYPAFKIGVVSMLVNVYLSILKRGTMSAQFMEKIQSDIENDLMIPGVVIDEAACKTFFTVYGQHINETNIGDITEHLTQLLPVSAMRLRLTVTQAAGSGLTALSVCGRALRTFNDFNWSRVSRMYPDEWANLIAAAETVGNNQWYGFSKNLNIVASTKYKNIAYVAKELLIKVNGDASLRSYRGWTRRAKYQNVVDALIADYKGHKLNNIRDDTPMPAVEDSQQVIQGRGIINNNPDVYA